MPALHSANIAAVLMHKWAAPRPARCWSAFPTVQIVQTGATVNEL